MSYSQKLYLVKEADYKKLMFEPKKNDQLEVKNLQNEFMENRIEQMTNDDATWVRMGNRLQPILTNSLTPAIQSAAAVAAPGAAGQPAEATATASQNLVEAALREGKDQTFLFKALKLLTLIENLPGVSIVDKKIVVNGVAMPGYGDEIILDLVRKRKSLLFSYAPLLQVISQEVKNPTTFIHNKAAREVIKKMSDIAKSPQGAEGGGGGNIVGAAAGEKGGGGGGGSVQARSSVPAAKSGSRKTHNRRRSSTGPGGGKEEEEDPLRKRLSFAAADIPNTPASVKAFAKSSKLQRSGGSNRKGTQVVVVPGAEAVAAAASPVPGTAASAPGDGRSGSDSSSRSTRGAAAAAAATTTSTTAPSKRPPYKAFFVGL